MAPRVSLGILILAAHAAAFIGPGGSADDQGPVPNTRTECYPDCDHAVGIIPCLTVQDFSCFLSRFANADPYANCDGSTGPAVLDVRDFVCFINRFFAGCSSC